MNHYLVFEAFQDTIFVIDEAGRLIYGNGAAAILLEVSPRRLTSEKPIGQFINFSPDPLLVESKGIANVIETTQTVEVSFNLPSGKSGWVQIVIQPEPEFLTKSRTTESETEAGKRWIVSMRDVTLEKNLHIKYRKELDNKEVVIRDLQEARAALEEYSHGLESKVQERTTELQAMNGLMKAILDSLGQGILVFDQSGKCLPVFSQVCRKLLRGEPPGRVIEDVLGLGPKLGADFQAWRNVVFDGALDFEDLAPLAPTGFKNTAGLDISLDYNAMMDANHQLVGIVVAVTDKTLEMAALKKAEDERLLVSKVTQVARNRTAFQLFVSDARRRLALLISAGSLGLDEIARELHTIKGGASSFALQDLTSACHELESELHGVNAERESRIIFDQTLVRRVPELLSHLETELSALTEILGPIGTTAENSTIDLPIERVLKWGQEILQASDIKVAQEVGRAILSECKEKPLGTSLGHLEPSLKDLASSYGKQLQAFVVRGGEARVDTELFEPLISSLIHSFRNSVYHGLETMEERRSVGKPEGGCITVHFEKETRAAPSGSRAAEWLKIEIQDDGRGVDPARIRKKLVSLGRNDIATAPDSEVIQAILLDDFSTAEQVDMVAGRGVGMSAIGGEAKRLGGSVVVHSILGQGMKLVITVPIPGVEANPAGRNLFAA